MEVILRQDVNKLGKAGSIIKVKNGYARNFLIPNNLAMPVTPANLKFFESEKQKKILQLEKEKQSSQEKKHKLEGLSLTLPVLTQGEDKLYGSISPQEIAQALKDEGFDIEEHSVILDEPIKSLGIYEVPIKLYPEVIAKIKVWIVKK